MSANGLKHVETDENGPNQNNNRGQGTTWHQIKLILSELRVFELQNEPSFKEFGGVWRTLQCSQETQESWNFTPFFSSIFCGFSR